MNLTTLCKTALLVFILNFICDSGYLTAQEHKPDSRIEIKERIREMQFSASGDYVFMFTSDLMRRYDLVRRRFDFQFALPRGAFGHNSTDLYMVNSDGTRLVCLDDEILYIIDLDSGDLLHKISHPYSFYHVWNAAFYNDDQRLLISGQSIKEGIVLDITIFVDIASGQWTPMRDVNVSVSNSGRLAILRDGKRVEVRTSYAAEPDNSKTSVNESIYSRVEPGSFSLSSDGTKLLLMESRYKMGVQENVVQENVWHVLDAHTLAAIHEPWVMVIPTNTTYGSELHLWRTAWLGDRPLALYSREQGKVTVFDVREQNELFAGSDAYPVMAFSPDGRRFAVTNGPFVDVYSSDSPTTDIIDQMHDDPQVLPPRLVPQFPVSDVWTKLAISGDGRIVAIDGDSDVLLLDRASRRQFRHITTDGAGTWPWAALSLSQDGSKLLLGNRRETVVWDVASGVLLQRYAHQKVFHVGGTLALICENMWWYEENKCWLQDLTPDGSSTLQKLQINIENSDIYQYVQLSQISAVSLAPDKTAVALAMGAKGVGWMELCTDGQQRVIHIPNGATVTNVAALSDSRVVAGLSTGVILLVDAVQGRIVKAHQTREQIDTITRLSDERLVITSHGKAPDTKPDDLGGIEILTVSSTDFSVLESNGINYSKNSKDHYIGSLVVSDDGRWLVVGWSGYLGFEPRVWLFDTTQTYSPLNLTNPSDLARVWAVDFGRDSNHLLVHSGGQSMLWNLQNTRPIQHVTAISPPALNDNDTLIYITDEASVKAWSIRSGQRDVTTIPPIIRHIFRLDKLESQLSPDGSCAAFGIGYHSNVIFLISLDESGAEPVTRINRSGVYRVLMDTVTDRVLLVANKDGLGKNSLELLNASSAESIWLRDDIYVGYLKDPMFTVDRTGMVVPTTDSLLILKSETGETRFSLNQGLYADPYYPTVPVLSETGVHGLLRMTNDGSWIVRLSLIDGSVIDSTNLGISDPVFAVANRDGDRWLIFDRSGLAVLWETTSDSKILFDAAPDPAYGANSVAFSNDDRLLAIAEKDGTVSLWDVSRGPAGLRRLVQLITFRDGD